MADLLDDDPTTTSSTGARSARSATTCNLLRDSMTGRVRGPRLDLVRGDRGHPRGRPDADRPIPGSFAELPAVDLGVLAAREAMRRSGVEPDQIDQTILGHARQAGNGPNTGRQVSVRAGVPVEVSAYNVNIACGSGMKAVQLGAQQIALGDSEVVLAGGMENMTRVPFLLDRMRTGYRMGDAQVYDAMYRDGLLDPLCGLIMGETAENLVDRYGLSRAEQDEFALESQQKAAAGARARGAEMFAVEAPAGQERGRAASPCRTTSTPARTRRSSGSRSWSPCSARVAASPPATRAGSRTEPPRCC